VVAAYSLTELEYRQAFSHFKRQYTKLYLPSEHELRYQTFKSNLDFVNNWDANARGFTVKMNEFGDLTSEEFSSIYNGLNITRTSTKRSHPVHVDAEAPDTWDWRQHGAVTGVKNQAQCGSCWAFSSTGSIEGAWFLAKKSLISFSEQDLVDCSTAEGNQGCNGGLMDQAFEYVIKAHGIDLESAYPYTATGPNACKHKASTVGAITSYHDVRSGDENDLLNSVALTPVSVAIDASHSSFQFYSTGIYYEPACSASQLDHGVLAIGWGNGYWLVKNSWGTGWGSAGFIQMSRNRNNNCGIATAASYPIV